MDAPNFIVCIVQKCHLLDIWVIQDIIQPSLTSVTLGGDVDGGGVVEGGGGGWE